MPYNAQFAARIDRAFADRGVRFETKRMMGGLVYMVNGRMCVGVEKNRLMVRLDPRDVPAALERPGCRPMDFTGRPLKAFVFVDGAVLGTRAALQEWLDMALAYNPQVPRAKKSRRT